ncbi:MAG TPA: site-specific DNA-methyltransferase [Verrucomicrobiae bacterium]|nr:site-specific DNA-methyltransferase [Verrucomicrobiae bacterium]
MVVSERWDAQADVSLYLGDTLDLLRDIPSAAAQLIVTSPPYNIGKAYERARRRTPGEYLSEQQAVITECVRILRPGGSICWEVGNHVEANRVLPLDILLFPCFQRHDELRLRNRIVWHFEHGLHCSRRFSGRYEVILWFTKGESYGFDLDPVRVPQKYPGKRAWKGKNAGQYSGHPLGKNPGDVWIFPNVKANHVEKTVHPCQFPVELVERFIVALTAPGDLVVDPYVGVGSTACAAVKHGRHAAGADIVPEYIRIARERVALAAEGKLATRPMDRPVHRPDPASPLARREPTPPPPVRPRRRRSPAQGLRIALRALGAETTSAATAPVEQDAQAQLTLAPVREPEE